MMTRSQQGLSKRKGSRRQTSICSASSDPPLLSYNPDFEDDVDAHLEDDSFSPDMDLEPSSDPITPPPSIALPPKPSKKRAAPAPPLVTDDSDSDSPPARKKSKGKARAAKELDSKRDLVLLIPRADMEGKQRQILTHATSFDDALAVIHEIIGCDNVGVKPRLMYKLSNATVKADAIGLGSNAYWDGCRQEVTAAETKTAVSVQIIVTEQVHHLHRFSIVLMIHSVPHLLACQAQDQADWPTAKGQGSQQDPHLRPRARRLGG
ncbi:hypothetical protein B0H11DRAFT_570076 [Mycena galericulata]|nr:hypothetical protein B0H11DRAFT_570076 [Mycena galericulata]